MISLDSDEKTRKDMILYRKYPLTGYMKSMMAWTIGCKLEASDDKNFSGPVQLHTISQLPVKPETVKFKTPQMFRYVRFHSDKKIGERGSHLAELEFYGLADNAIDTIKLTGKVILSDRFSDPEKSKIQNLFDNNLLTYFEFTREKSSWVGLDFGKPRQIVKVKYCPRNDVNFIEPGHSYELCYWKNGKWISLGKKTATDQLIRYRNVPSKGLYVLHDLTAGKEERIFTCEKGIQKFW